MKVEMSNATHMCSEDVISEKRGGKRQVLGFFSLPKDLTDYYRTNREGNWIDLNGKLMPHKAQSGLYRKLQ